MNIRRVLLALVPKNHLSYLVGCLVSFRLPPPLSWWSVRIFARAVGLDESEARRPLREYRSIGELFVRDLKEHLRKVEAGVVSPVDGALRDGGTIQDGVIRAVKGRDYDLSTLLGSEELASSFTRGFYFNLYLSPKDYHHVHAPVSGDIVSSVYIPGKLWPVNDWSLRNIEDLFSRNERLVTLLRTARGMVAVVMVGATNVGRMSVVYDSVTTNSLARLCRGRAAKVVRNHLRHPYPIQKGERLGTFHMGSSVVLLLSPELTSEGEAVNFETLPAVIRYGESLYRFSSE